MSDERPNPSPGIWDLVGIGSYNVACLLAGLAGGWLVDDALDTTPVFTLVGLALGITIGIIGAWLHIRIFLRS